MLSIAKKSWIRYLWINKGLFWKFCKRDIQGRYRGSVLGWSWSLITPILMLAVYTFVFSKVFQARWGDLDNDDPWLFAINLFAGLIVFNIFAETANASVSAITKDANLATKVIFPLGLLPAVTVVNALFHGFTSLAVLAGFQLLSQGYIPITFILIPIVWIPFTIGCLGLSWLLSSLGVFIRDISQFIGISTSLLMFMSAVFYPLSALPLRWQPILGLNPLVKVIEQTRYVAIDGKIPSVSTMILSTLGALIFSQLCFKFFQTTKSQFSDVL